MCKHKWKWYLLCEYWYCEWCGDIELRAVADALKEEA